MNIDLRLHGTPVKSVFSLVGFDENSITYSLGWSLSRSAQLRSALLTRLFGRVFPSEVIQSVELQSRARDGEGITDIELRGRDIHVILEAKRFWSLPKPGQLRQYVPRINRKRYRAIVTTSECTTEHASRCLKKRIGGVDIIHVPWSEIHAMARHARTGRTRREERYTLNQLSIYMDNLIRIQNKTSNLVYVVAIASDTPPWSKIAWKAIVEDRNRYFHPVGTRGGWPKEPPNYIGFRYDGKLQSIHHVESWKITTNIHTEMRELNPRWKEPYILYTLGPPIVPSDTVKTGSIFRGGRVWAALDLLLTCKTIAEARDRTKQRLDEV